MKLPYGYEAHPAADAFPMLSQAELEALAADIKENGLKQPIALDPKGRVLDGRNRLVAYSLAFPSRPAPTTVVTEEPTRFVLSQNLHRRQLNKGQKATVTYLLVKDTPWFQEMAEAADSSSGRSKEGAALCQLVGCGPDTADKAIGLCKTADEREIQAVATGRVPLVRAYFDTGGRCGHGRIVSRKAKLNKANADAMQKRVTELSAQVKELKEKQEELVEERLQAMGVDTTCYTPIAFEKQAAELAETKARLKTTKKEALRLQSRLDHLTIARSHVVVPKPVIPRYPDTEREACLGIALSDWHLAENIRKEEVNFSNEFNLEIASKRITRLGEGILWKLDLFRNRFKINQMIVACLGDMISGSIHKELTETNEIRPADAVRLCLQHICSYIIDPILLNTDIERIVVPCLPGNHGRFGEWRTKHAAKDSHEWYLYDGIQEYYKNEPRVEVHLCEGKLFYFDVYGFKLRFLHGDVIRYRDGVGGPTIPLLKKIYRYNQENHAHLTVLGHLHTYNPGPNYLINGSLCGYSEFAVAGGFAYEEPRQAMFLIDSKRGVCDMAPIWV